jgi:hypothetical protein
MPMDMENKKGKFTQTKTSTGYRNVYESGLVEDIAITPTGYSRTTTPNRRDVLNDNGIPQGVAEIPSSSAAPSKIVGVYGKLGANGEIEKDIYTQEGGTFQKVQGQEIPQEIRTTIKSGYANPVTEAYYRQNPMQRPKNEETSIPESKIVNKPTPSGVVSLASKEQKSAMARERRLIPFQNFWESASSSYGAVSGMGLFGGVRPEVSAKAKSNTASGFGLLTGSVAGLATIWASPKLYSAAKGVTTPISKVAINAIGKFPVALGEGIIGGAAVYKGTQLATFTTGTTLEERNQLKVIKSDIKAADVAKQNYVAQQGFLSQIKEGIYQGWVTPRANQVFTNTLGASLENKGYSSEEVNKLVGVGQIYKASQSRGELAGMLFIGKTSEKLGQSTIVPVVRSIPKEERTVVKVAGKTWKYFIPAGFLEGSISTGLQQSARNDPRKFFNFGDTKMTNLLGFIPVKSSRVGETIFGGALGATTATALGVPPVSFAFGKTARTRVIGKGIEYIGYGIDPTEKPSDILESVSAKAASGLSRRKTYINTVSFGVSQPISSNSNVLDLVPISSNVNTAVSVPVNSNVPVSVKTSVPSNVNNFINQIIGVPVPVNTNNPISVPSFVDVNTNVNIPVNTNVPVDTNVPVNVNVIGNPQVPFLFPPFELPTGWGGFGGNVRLKKAYVNELAYGLGIFGAGSWKKQPKKKEKGQRFTIHINNGKVSVKQSKIGIKKPKQNMNKVKQMINRIL